MSAAIQPRGWCPGALRPMLSGDGWLVRLRISGGVVSASAARAIADCAKTYGNGLLDLSARANLQLRGVRQASLPALVEALQAHGLIDESAEAESVRNVLASPLAGLAPDAAFDIRPYVRALERRLASDEALHGLPSKFGFIIDDGGGLSLSGVGADIRFLAVHGEGAPRFMVGIESCDDAVVVEAAELPDVAARLAIAFLEKARQCETLPRRMGALVTLRGAACVWRAAGIAATHQTTHACAPPQPLGHHRLGDFGFLGLGLAFGRLRSQRRPPRRHRLCGRSRLRQRAVANAGPCAVAGPAGSRIVAVGRHAACLRLRQGLRAASRHHRDACCARGAVRSHHARPRERCSIAAWP